MSTIFGTSRGPSFGAYGPGIRDEVPPWCLKQADFQECVTRQTKGCTNDCTDNTWEPEPDCAPKCTQAWTQIQCTPKCLRAQPKDPNPSSSPIVASTSFWSQASFGIPNFAWAAMGAVAAFAGVVVWKRR